MLPKEPELLKHDSKVPPTRYIFHNITLTVSRPLKYAVEVLALRLALHRSIQDLRSDLRVKTTLPLESLSSYRRYTAWLWLFNMAHYCSIVSGTPPSIRIDYSIRAASSIVDKIGKGLHFNNLFGIVELYMIWEKVKAVYSHLVSICLHYMLGQRESSSAWRMVVSS